MIPLSTIIAGQQLPFGLYKDDEGTHIEIFKDGDVCNEEDIKNLIMENITDVYINIGDKKKYD